MLGAVYVYGTGLLFSVHSIGANRLGRETVQPHANKQVEQLRKVHRFVCGELTATDAENGMGWNGKVLMKRKSWCVSGSRNRTFVPMPVCINKRIVAGAIKAGSF